MVAYRAQGDKSCDPVIDKMSLHWVPDEKMGLALGEPRSAYHNSCPAFCHFCYSGNAKFLSDATAGGHTITPMRIVMARVNAHIGIELGCARMYSTRRAIARRKISDLELVWRDTEGSA